MSGAMQSASRLDLERLKYLTENFNTLQGLRSMAFGIGYAVFMMSNAYWGSGGWSIFGSLCFLAAYKISETYIPRYYDRRFGNVKQSPRRVRRWSRRQLLFGFVQTVVVSLVWILADFLLPNFVPGSRFTNSMVLAFGVACLFGFPSAPRRKGLVFMQGIAITAFALAPIWYPLNESQLFA
jgi:hypothetical protein